MASRARSFYLSMTTAERRALSPVFVVLPWATEELVQSPKGVSDFLTSMPQHKHFLNALHAYETRLLAFRGRNSGGELLQLLGMDVEYAQSPGYDSNVVAVRASSTSASTVFDYLKICSHICAFRVFEVLGMQSGVLTRSSATTIFPTLCLPKPAGESDTLYGMDKLDDWPKVLLEFRRLVLNAASKDPSIEFVQQGSGFFSLLRMRRQVRQQRGYYNVVDNFLSAALHVYLMRMIHVPDGVLPDYPADLESRKYNIFANEISSSDYVSDIHEGNHYLEELNGAGASASRNAASLRAALHLALLISPFFLLFTFNIGTKSFSRRLALEIFSKYARRKSPLVVEIESHILNTLTRLSKGDVHPQVVFMDLINALPWDAIEAASNTDQRRMFSAMEVMPCTSSETLALNDGLHAATSVESRSPEIPAEAAFIRGSGDSVSLPVTTIPLPLTSSLSASPLAASDDSESVEVAPGPLSSVTVQSGDPTGVSCISSACPSSDSGQHAFVSGTASSLASNVCSTDPPLHSGSDLYLSARQSTPGTEDSSSSASETGISLAASLASCINLALDASAIPTSSSVENATSLPPTEADVQSLSSTHDMHSISSMSECSSTSGSDSDVSLTTGRSQSGPSSDAEDATNGGGGGASKPEPKASSNAQAEEEPSGSKPNLRKRRKSFSSKSLVDSGSDSPPDKQKTRPPPRKRPKLSSTLNPGVTVHHGLLVGDSLDNPINIDDLPSLFEPAVAHDYIKKEDISLGTEAPPPKIKSDVSFVAWDADNNPITFTPEFHYQTYIDRFKQFMKKTMEGYVDGKPPFLSEPKHSLFDVIKYDDFIALSSSEVQERMEKKHLVVTGMPHEDNVQFDETAMRTLIGSLSSQVSINDFSIKPADGDCMPAVVSGYASDILLNARQDGKILNGLDFPMGDADRRPNRYAVDLDAWNVTCGQHRVPLNSAYPTEHMRWGSGGTRNTITLLHIDCDGLNTNYGPICGLKLWGVAESVSSELPRSSIYFFLHEGFSIDEVKNDACYRFEAIVLRPGDVIYMKANTPHFVYGITPAICHGGHYFLTRLMQQTLQGVIHAFVLNKYLTNTQHWPTRPIFRRILFFYHLAVVEGCVPLKDRSYVHVPDVNTFNGLLDLLSVCVIVVLGNVLDFRTYKAPNLHDCDEATHEQASILELYDINDVPYNERVASCYARGVALYMMQWIRSCTVIKGPDGEIVPDLPSFFLVQILNSLITYKLAASRRKYNGAPHCTYPMLKSQALNVLDCSDPTLKGAWDLRSSMPGDSLELADKDKYSLEWKHGWETTWRAPSRDFLVSGLTPFDKKYFYAIRGRSSTGKK